jgi:hypothetical protein
MCWDGYLKDKDTMCWWVCEKRENPCTLLVEMQSRTTPINNSTEISQKLKKQNFNASQ